MATRYSLIGVSEEAQKLAASVISDFPFANLEKRMAVAMHRCRGSIDPRQVRDALLGVEQRLRETVGQAPYPHQFEDFHATD